MTRIKSIQLKAGFLLVVFSLNTIIGFACAVGLDMSFNSSHHVEEVTKAIVHVHVDGKKHVHKNEANEHNGEKAKDHHKKEEVTIATVHIHADGKKHVHNNEAKEAANEHHDEKVKDHHETNDKDNCCNDDVTKIIQQDKAIATSITITTPIFFTAFIAGFYNADALLSTGADSHIKYFVWSHHPPIPDIRIAIQSFQI
ncbi:MAG: hypothetical protein ABIP35_13280 [Ginsengibacter sp.]